MKPSVYSGNGDFYFSSFWLNLEILWSQGPFRVINVILIIWEHMLNRMTWLKITCTFILTDRFILVSFILLWVIGFLFFPTNFQLAIFTKNAFWNVVQGIYFFQLSVWKMKIGTAFTFEIIRVSFWNVSTNTFWMTHILTFQTFVWKVPYKCYIAIGFLSL
jgi:hypothetical protein